MNRTERRTGPLLAQPEPPPGTGSPRPGTYGLEGHPAAAGAEAGIAAARRGIAAATARATAPAAAFFLAAILATFAQSSLGRAEASCRCCGGELELVIVLDVTGSMQHMIGTLKAQLAKILTVLRGRLGKLRVGIVTYKAHEASGQGLPVVETLPLTSDIAKAAEFLQKSKAVGGGFEAVELGMEAAISGDMGWTKGARKVLILVGDEPCPPQREALCVRLAAEAAEKGIAVNTVTASETAWRYYAMLNEADWKRMLEREGERAKTGFRMPLFVEMADKGRGIAVSSNGSRELVMWLLAFGLGLGPGREKELDLDAYFRWTEPDGETAGDTDRSRGRKSSGGAGVLPPGRPLVGWVRHGGYWNVPHDFECLLRGLKSKVETGFDTGAEAVYPREADLARFPILYMSGHGPLSLPEGEVSALASHVRRGGFLFAEACCGDADFDVSFRQFAERAFGAGSLRRLPPGHPVFRCGYDIRKVRFDSRPRVGEFREVEPELSGVELEGRLAVVYSARDLGCCWMTLPLGLPCQHHDEDGLALTVNILLHALTR
ncbi:MAG: DUF4159 domain-containing protein [Planctomycetota bacterium]|nr:DUF4159 domain-containing protein [Planctomycetota bacterium]